MLSLCAVFHTAFLVPASDLHQTILNSLELLSSAAGVSLVSGLIFRESAPVSSESSRILTTLPVQVFCWAATTMFLLFVCCWYLESHCIFYRDIHY
jgi:hypothetical protein